MSKALFEKRFAEVNKAIETGESDFPFGLTYEQGQIWLKSEQSTLLWVLEMIDD